MQTNEYDHRKKMSPILSTPYTVLSLFATRFGARAGGIWVSFIEPFKLISNGLYGRFSLQT